MLLWVEGKESNSHDWITNNFRYFIMLFQISFPWEKNGRLRISVCGNPAHRNIKIIGSSLLPSLVWQWAQGVTLMMNNPTSQATAQTLAECVDFGVRITTPWSRKNNCLNHTHPKCSSKYSFSSRAREVGSLQSSTGSVVTLNRRNPQHITPRTTNVTKSVVRGNRATRAPWRAKSCKGEDVSALI